MDAQVAGNEQTVLFPNRLPTSSEEWKLQWKLFVDFLVQLCAVASWASKAHLSKRLITPSKLGKQVVKLGRIIP